MLEDPAHLPGFLDHPAQVLAGDLLAIAQAQGGAFDAHLHQVIVQRRLVLQIDLGLAAADLVERRLRDVEEAALDDLRHLPEEEREQQRADMRAVHVRIGHDDDLVIAQLVDVELVPADAGAKRGDQGADLLAAQHPVEAGAFDVQDLAAQRQHRLVRPGTALLGRAAGAVALDQEQLAVGRVAGLAIGKLPGQRGDVERGFLPGQFPGPARGFPRERRLDDLADDGAGFVRVLLEPLGQLLVQQPLDRRPHLGRDQLVLGLAGEFRIWHLHRQDAGQPFAGIVAREGHLLAPGQPRGVGIGVDRPGQRAAEAGEMGAAIPLWDVVGEGQHHLVIAVVPPQRGLDADAVAFAGDEDRVGNQWRLRPVEPAHELAHAAVIVQLGPERFGRAFVFQHDAHARVQEGQLAQAVFQRLVAVVEVREGLVRRQETHLRAGPPWRLADHAQVLDRLAGLEPGIVFLALAPDRQVEPVRQRVHHRHADAVQATGNLVGILVELAARVELGHDHLGRRDAFALVDADRDAAAVIGDRDRVVGMDLDLDPGGVARQHLVDAVVHHLVHHVVQARAVVGVADIHPRPLAHRFQAFENHDGIGAVVGRGRSGFGHAEQSFILSPAYRRRVWQCHASGMAAGGIRSAGAGAKLLQDGDRCPCVNGDHPRLDPHQGRLCRAAAWLWPDRCKKRKKL